jgi:saccharopine dehydrogenase-like NADP-dependent oxidoreductase
LQLDRAGDLAPLWARSPDAVVDAAGPFHAYGADPYRLAKSAIAQGVSYLDLADDAEFCAGIAV